MLCDQIIADGVPASGCDIRRMLPQIRAAQKFVLSPEFTAVADALSVDYTGLVRAFPHCRLPYQQTWIELAHAERATFSKAEMIAPDWQVKPHRVGYLLSATRDDLSAWKVHLFWSTDKGCSCPPMAMEFDMIGSFGPVQLPMMESLRERIESSLVLTNAPAMDHPGWTRASDSVKLAMLAHTKPSIPNYGLPYPIGIPRERINEYSEAMVDLARADWAGEPAYLLAVIGLLNARNAVETEAVDYRKLNHARMKRGKPPLFEHKLLKISRRQQKRVYNGSGPVSNHAPMRGHFVMGHWKVRKTGIFFWHPFKRGDFTRGRIEKDYEVI